MGFKPNFWKKKTIGKTIRTYVKGRVKEKRSFEEQLERLEAQLLKRALDQNSYERMRDILEASFVQQQEESRAHIQDTFLKTSPF
jgi:hypothetical protein